MGFPYVFFNSFEPRCRVDSNGVKDNGHILQEPASEVPWTAGHGSVTCDVIRMPLILATESHGPKSNRKSLWLKMMDKFCLSIVYKHFHFLNLIVVKAPSPLI